MELQTERLVLREYTLDDFAAVHSFSSDVRIAEYVDWGPNSAGDTQQFLERCVAAQADAVRTNFTFAVTFANRDPFGSVGLSVDHGRGELGCVIHPDHWAHGYATEAAASLLRFGHETLKLRGITATCRPENTPSARVLEKIGMVRVGLRTADNIYEIHHRPLGINLKATSTTASSGTSG
jgi:ribosomal-protein-alanine N-acetyltransferase